MIHRKDYTFIMSEKLHRGSSGNYSIARKTMEKGTLLRTYSPAGFFYIDRVNSSMPVVMLLNGGCPVMSDTPMEQEGLRIPVIAAHGDVLTMGLGIGLFPTLLREHNKTVKSITIVESSKHVAKLVYEHIANSHTELIVSEGKKFLSTCKKKYDFIFIDVWNAFTTTIKEIDEWTELAKPCLREGGEVRCWLQELYDRIKDKLPTEPAEPTGLPAIYAPCLICGKKLRNDYAGLCMDCADDMEVSEMYIRRKDVL